MNVTECKTHQGTAFHANQKVLHPRGSTGKLLGGGRSVSDSARWVLMECGSGQLRRKQRKRTEGQRVAGQGRTELGLARA